MDFRTTLETKIASRTIQDVENSPWNEKRDCFPPRESEIARSVDIQRRLMQERVIE